jgi:hypothetical protein
MKGNVQAHKVNTADTKKARCPSRNMLWGVCVVHMRQTHSLNSAIGKGTIRKNFQSSATQRMYDTSLNPAPKSETCEQDLSMSNVRV